MIGKKRKYIFTITAFLLWGHLMFGLSAVRTNGHPGMQEPPLDIVVPPPGVDTTEIDLNAPGAIIDPGRIQDGMSQDGQEVHFPPQDSFPRRSRPADPGAPGQFLPDGSEIVEEDDGLIIAGDTVIIADSLRMGPDSLREPKKFLDDPISGRNKDSLVYKVREKKVYIYNEGDIDYTDMNLKADYIEVDLETKIIIGDGITDTLGVRSRPEFTESGTLYTMEHLEYNLETKVARVRGAETQEGDGYMIGDVIKKMPDNSINVAGGKYTTCDHLEHPHFYLRMTKARKVGDKIIVGPSYMVLEDVPIYFPLIPFGFFPISSGRSSGFIMPSYGEENTKGFFIRDGGYYFAFSDYADLTALAGIYTLGSWQASVSSRYIKRYKFSGGFNARFSKDIFGEKGSADYVNMNNFNVQWTHQQDPKFRPNTTFSASVNFSTSGYSKYGSNTMNDYLNTQTNSSVAYSKTWPGKPFSLSTNFQHSQNSRDTTVSLSFPNVVFNVSTLYPFKSKNRAGRERWYEKVNIKYTGTMTNTVTVHERDLFTTDMYKNMRNGINHQIPISTSLTLFDYFNISPSANYTERWYFRKIDRDWNPDTRAVEATDTTYGFYRVYNYNFSVSANTKIYGMFQFGDSAVIRAIRHVITPTLSASYTPDFGDPKFGFYKPIQSNEAGDVTYYSPYDGNAYGVPGRGQSAALQFSLSNTLEMKVRSQRDTSGVKKIKLIDELRFSGSYNFLADSLNLSVISASLRTTLVKNLGLNISATFDPYQIDERGRRINKFMVKNGKLARLTSASTSFGYSFNSTGSGGAAMNDINSGGMPTPQDTEFFANQNITDPNLQRMMMTSQYYDFDIPWNIGFNYSFSYSNTGLNKRITQTLGFNGSITPTANWGLNFSGGYDFETNKLTPGVVTINRDLHCWQMNLSWVPVGYRKSWSFTIRVKSAVLQDLKYDKRNSHYDNLSGY